MLVLRLPRVSRALLRPCGLLIRITAASRTITGLVRQS